MDTFYSATVAPGAVNLAPSLYSDVDTFFSATVSSTYALTPSLVTDGDTFFPATVTSANSLLPSLFANPNSFGIDGVYDDASGNGHDGTANGSPSSVAGDAGQGNALQFGGSDWVTVTDDAALDITGAITLVARVKVTTFDVAWQAILTKGDSAWRLHRNSSSNFVAFGTSGLTQTDLAGTISINDGAWHHIVAVYDGSANKYIYHNGALDASVGATGSISTNGTNFLIGENAEQSGRGWKGNIDDVRIYNRALSSTEANQLYQGVHITSGLVAYYPFETGTVVNASNELTPALVSDGDTFYSATVAAADQPLTPSLYSDADTFYSPTVAATYALTPSLYSDADTFYSPSVAQSLSASLYSDGDTFYSPQLDLVLFASLYSDADTFFAPTVASTYSLTPSLFSDADFFYGPTITTANTLTPSLYSDADTFFSATVTPGSVNLSPSLYSDGDTFHTPTVLSTYALTPSLYSDADTFYSAAVTAANTITPSLYSDADTFFSATVTTIYALTPSLYSDADTFYAPTALSTYALTPSLYSDGDTFFSPTASATYALTPSLYSDADTFYSATVTPGSVDLAPTLYTDGDTFYAVVVFPLTTIQPDADITDGNWVNEVGSNVDLYASVDEALASDSDYIRSGDSPSADIVRLRLSNHDATPNEPYRVRYRYQRAGGLVGGRHRSQLCGCRSDVAAQ